MSNPQYHLNYKAKPGNHQKLIARRQCSEAIRKGVLVRQPCETCGATAVEAHHDNYEMPLNVRWLCRPCHVATHRGSLRGGKLSHCARGHELTGLNLRFSIEGGVERHRCRQCHTDATRKRRAKL